MSRCRNGTASPAAIAAISCLKMTGPSAIAVKTLCAWIA